MNKPENLLLRYQHSEMKESDLLAGIKNGNRESFRQLFLSHKDSVFRTSMSLLKDFAEAEDITQEIFLKVFKSINQFEGRSTLRTWIMRITVNLCMDRLKSQEFKRKESSLPLDEKVLVDTQKIQETGVIKMIESMISSLPINTRTVFILKTQRGLKHEDIACLMDISVGTSKSQYSHARSLLRKKLLPFKEALFDEL